jgi:lysophospholipase L1-like esterase
LARAALLLALATLSACGDAVAQPKPSGQKDVASAPAIWRAPPSAEELAQEPVKVIPVTAAAATTTGSEVAGALENAKALARVLDKLDRLEAGLEKDDVRIVQFGDSHTLADLGTSAARKALQARFGDGGRGFVAIGRPFKYWVQDGVRNGMSNDWATERGRFDKGHFVGDGLYGLGGAALTTDRRGARAWVETKSPVSQIDLAYLAQPRGGSVDVMVDGAKVAHVSTKGQKVESGWKSVDVPEGTHNVEVRTSGDGGVRLFGVGLERQQSGVVYDAIGINGVRASVALQWSEAHMTEQLRHRAPDLVILAYGTNESTDDTSNETYERQLVDVLGRIARAVPSASCLLLGPPDRAIDSAVGYITAPRILQVIAVQRRVAEAAGCAYYSQFDAMGGDGSMATWALEEPPRAQRDRVHLTREGYTQLGTSFASDLLRAYGAFRTEKHKHEQQAAVQPAPKAQASAPSP